MPQSRKREASGTKDFNLRATKSEVVHIEMTFLAWVLRHCLRLMTIFLRWLNVLTWKTNISSTFLLHNMPRRKTLKERIQWKQKKVIWLVSKKSLLTSRKWQRRFCRVKLNVWFHKTSRQISGSILMWSTRIS